MIQDIEHLGSELQLEPLTNGKISVYGEVPLRKPESPECVTAEIPLAKGIQGCRIDGRIGEGVGI
jgi:hypothetical protein